MRRLLTVLRFCVWLLVVGATAWVWLSTAEKPSSPALPTGVTLLRDAPYRFVEGQRLALDLYLPDVANAAPGDLHPILIAVHGGSWIGGSKTDHGPQLARLARRGIAVAVVDYRLARPGAPSWPGAAKDISAALDWLEARAEKYRLDPTRAAVIGTSSGGHLAALASLMDRRFGATVCLSAPMDLGRLMEERSLPHEPALTFLGPESSGLATRARDASPIQRVSPGQSPMLLIHGTDDLWVPIDQARNMRRTMKEAGAPVRLIEIEGARHGFQLLVGAPSPRDLLPDVVDFLEEAWRTSNAERPGNHAAEPVSSRRPALVQR